jgi:hypothetical protein
VVKLAKSTVNCYVQNDMAGTKPLARGYKGIRALYHQFAGDRRDDDLGNPARWMEADEANLEERRNAPIKMGDTA